LQLQSFGQNLQQLGHCLLANPHLLLRCLSIWDWWLQPVRTCLAHQNPSQKPNLWALQDEQPPGVHWNGGEHLTRVLQWNRCLQMHFGTWQQHLCHWLAIQHIPIPHKTNQALPHPLSFPDTGNSKSLPCPQMFYCGLQWYCKCTSNIGCLPGKLKQNQ
jgi:hypothetical protein